MKMEKNLKKIIKGKISFTKKMLINFLMTGLFLSFGVNILADNIVVTNGGIGTSNGGGYSHASITLNPYGYGSTTIYDSSRYGKEVTVIGYGANAYSDYGVALGRGAIVSGKGVNGQGSNNSVNGVALGSFSFAKGTNSIAIGASASTSSKSVTLNEAQPDSNSDLPYSNNAIAIGSNVNLLSDNGILLGSHSKVGYYITIKNGNVDTGEAPQLNRNIFNNTNYANNILFGTTSYIGAQSGDAVLIGSNSVIGNASGATVLIGKESSIANPTQKYIKIDKDIYPVLEYYDDRKSKNYYIDNNGELKELGNKTQEYLLNNNTKETTTDQTKAASSNSYENVLIGKKAKISANTQDSIGIGTGAFIAQNTKNSSAIGVESYVGPNIENSIAMGYRAKAIKTNASAFGSNSLASGENSFAFGNSSNATNLNATSLGFESQAKAPNSFALGSNSKATENAKNSFVAGVDAQSNTASSVIIGQGTMTLGTTSDPENGANIIAIGTGSTVGKDSGNVILLGSKTTVSKMSGGSVVIGVYNNLGTNSGTGNSYNTVLVGSNINVGDNSHGNIAIGKVINVGSNSLKNLSIGPNTTIGSNVNNSFVIGSGASISDGTQNSYAIGIGSSASGSGNIAFGNEAQTSSNISNSVALGYQSKTDYTALNDNPYTPKGALLMPTDSKFGVISVGNKNSIRRIVNLAAGSKDTDAVNVSQLKALEETLESRLGNSNESGDIHYFSVNTTAIGGKAQKDAGIIKFIQLRDNLVKSKKILLTIKLKERDGSQYNQETVNNIQTRVNDLINNLKSAGQYKGDLEKFGNLNISELGSDFDTAIKTVDDKADLALKTQVTIDGKTEAEIKATTNYDNNLAVGKDSIAIGYSAATGGKGTQEAGSQAIALGLNAKANGNNSIAIGSGNTDENPEQSTNVEVNGKQSVGIGNQLQVNGNKSVVIGIGHTVKGNSNIVLGDPNTIYGNNNVLEGNNINIGTDGNTKDGNNIVFGNNISSKSNDIVNTVLIGNSIGEGSTKSYGVNIGDNTKVTIEGGIALGQNSESTRAISNESLIAPFSKVELKDKLAGALSVGNENKLRQIINVADGTQDTDAVNLRQLKAISKAGLDFSGNDYNESTATTTIHKNIGERLSIEGKSGATYSADKYTSDNLATYVDNGVLRISMLKTPTLEGLNLKSKEEDAKPVSLTPDKDGNLKLSNGPEDTSNPNANKVTLTGLKAGDSDDSAITKKQLDDVINKGINIKVGENTLKLKLGGTLDLNKGTNIEITGTESSSTESSSTESSSTESSSTESSSTGVSSGSDTASSETSKNPSISISTSDTPTFKGVTVKGDNGVTTSITPDSGIVISENDKKITINSDGITGLTSTLKTPDENNADESNKVPSIEDQLNNNKNLDLSKAATIGDLKEVFNNANSEFNIKGGSDGEDSKGIQVGTKKPLTIEGENNITVNTSYSEKTGNVIKIGITDPVNDNDVVNKKYVDGVVKENNSLSDAGVANALATASIPQVNENTGKIMVGAALGAYGKEQALAVGVSGGNDARNLVYKMSFSVNTRGKFGATAGIGYTFGKYKEKRNLESEIDSLKKDIASNQGASSENQKLKQQLNDMQQKFDKLVKEFATRDIMYVLPNFITGKYQLTNKQVAQIKNIVKQINDNYSNRIIDITGYTDTEGKEKNNLQLGLNRARQVEQLLRKYGLREDFVIRKVSSSGFNNIVENVGQNGANRRVEIICSF